MSGELSWQDVGQVVTAAASFLIAAVLALRLVRSEAPRLKIHAVDTRRGMVVARGALPLLAFPVSIGLVNLSRNPNAVLTVRVSLARAKHGLGLRLDADTSTGDPMVAVTDPLATVTKDSLPLAIPAFGIANLSYVASGPLVLLYEKDEASEMEEGETFAPEDVVVVVEDVFGRRYRWQERRPAWAWVRFRVWQAQHVVGRAWERFADRE